MNPKMIHCMQCGAKLEMKYLESEHSDIPWCPVCGDYRFPVFNTAVSMIITDPSHERICMIRQYGGDEYILCAGYVSKGEDAEDAAVREIREELGFEVRSLSFNRSHYYKPSNTLMLNFTAVVNETEAHPNEEIDLWNWFSREDAEKYIRRNSLAEAFLRGYLGYGYTFPTAPEVPYKL